MKIPVDIRLAPLAAIRAAQTTRRAALATLKADIALFERTPKHLAIRDGQRDVAPQHRFRYLAACRERREELIDELSELAAELYRRGYRGGSATAIPPFRTEAEVVADVAARAANALAEGARP